MNSMIKQRDKIRIEENTRKKQGIIKNNLMNSKKNWLDNNKLFNIQKKKKPD